jgi:hypothetical protein
MKLGEVTLVKDCMICRKEVILIARKNAKAELPKKNSILPKVCEACREKYLTKGVLLINPNNGRLVVLKDEAFSRIFKDPIPERKIAFTDDELLDKLEEKNGNEIRRNRI